MLGGRAHVDWNLKAALKVTLLVRAVLGLCGILVHQLIVPWIGGREPEWHPRGCVLCSGIHRGNRRQCFDGRTTGLGLYTVGVRQELGLYLGLVV